MRFLLLVCCLSLREGLPERSLDGVGLHAADSPFVWQFPFGFQLVPAGIMLIGLFTVAESPRWLASVGRSQEAIKNLAYLRKEPMDSNEVLHEIAEIEAAIEEERVAREGLGWKEAFLGKGNFIRFIIAFTIMFLQQWGGQNSVGYYAPQIFTSVSPDGLHACESGLTKDLARLATLAPRILSSPQEFMVSSKSLLPPSSSSLVSNRSVEKLPSSSLPSAWAPSSTLLVPF